MRLASYLTLLRTAEQRLGDSYRFVADGHAEEPDVVATCRQFATQADHHVSTLDPVTSRYLKLPSDEPLSAQADRWGVTWLGEPRTGPLGLLRDMHDLYALAGFVDLAWTIVGQAAQAARDTELSTVVTDCESDVTRQLAWLTTRV